MRFILFACLVVALQTRAVEISLTKTNIAIPAGRTFQMPITASDAGGGPLTFSVVSITPKKLTATFSSVTNRSLVFNVSGVDATNAPFTGDIVLQLFEDLTPRTTARIIDLVSSNFYGGQTFLHVVQDFVCQAGNTNGNSGVAIDDEYAAELTYTGFGQLGLAKSTDFFGNIINDTGDSQIFITDVDLSVDDTNKPSPRYLDFEYTLFGQVTRGFDVITKIMETPVAGSIPITPVVINSATIITNSQDAVLRLSASPSFTGFGTVTVSARNANNETATQSFGVSVIANTVNDPPFLGPIPPSLVVTQFMAASFILTLTNLEGDHLMLGLSDVATGRFPTNFTASIDSSLRLWFVPDLTVTGTVNLLFSITDSLHPADSQHFSITVIPKGDTPTLTILPKSGSLVSSVSSNADRIKVAGTFAFGGASDHAFTFEDIIVLSIGDPASPLMLTLPPDAPGRSTKHGIVKFKSSKGTTNAVVSAQFNGPKGTFKIAVSNFDFPAAISNQVQVGITVGNDYGTDTRAWTEKKPGVFIFPKP
jgi:cyclophilin family peptidyl-prolyl cis-trans isomerase